jgi:branched-chain amino acid transport system substrate-binding protein
LSEHISQSSLLARYRSVLPSCTVPLDYVADLALPGMTTSTKPDDYRINKQFQMMRFGGQRWVLFGPILTDESKTN